MSQFKPLAVLFDIDGVLADMDHRKYLLSEKPVDWDKFYLAAILDNPMHSTIKLLKIIYQSQDTYNELNPRPFIFLITGRSSKYENLTKMWLNDYGIRHDGLYMRPEGDHRPDSEVKKEIYRKEIKDNFNVIAVFEDRTRVVEMWRAEGLTCWQNCDGDY